MYGRVCKPHSDVDGSELPEGDVETVEVEKK
jgi:hypothetical protein